MSVAEWAAKSMAFARKFPVDSPYESELLGTYVRCTTQLPADPEQALAHVHGCERCRIAYEELRLLKDKYSGFGIPDGAGIEAVTYFVRRCRQEFGIRPGSPDEGGDDRSEMAQLVYGALLHQPEYVGRWDELADPAVLEKVLAYLAAEVRYLARQRGMTFHWPVPEPTF